jgi:hypothetical protein
VTYRTWKSRNFNLWSKGNPLLHEELQRNPLHVVIRTRISAGHMFGQNFFQGPMNQRAYLSMSRGWLVVHIEHMNLTDKACVQ